MHYVQTALKSLVYRLLFFIVLLISLLAVLITTTPGLYLTAKLISVILPGELAIENLQGRMINHFFLSHLRYKNDKINLDLANFDLQWQLKALLHPQIIINRLYASKLVINLKTEGIPFKKTDFSKLPFKLSIHEAAVNQITIKKNGVTMNIKNLHWQGNSTQKIGFNSAKGSLRVDGTIPLQAEWQIRAQTTNQGLGVKSHIESPSGKIDLSVNYNRTLIPKIQGKIIASLLNLNDQNLPLKKLKINTEFTGDSLDNLSLNTDLITQYFNHLLHLTLRYQNQHLNACVNLGANQLQLKGSFPYQWQLLATIPKLQLLHPALKDLQATINAKGSLSGSKKGNLILSISPGRYQLHENKLASLPFMGGKLNAQLDSNHLEINGNLTIDPQKSLLLNLILPQFQLNHFSPTKQKIQGHLNLTINSLDFLENLDPLIHKASGHLSAIIKTHGSLIKPSFEGNIKLEQGVISLPKLGIELNPVQGNIHSHEKRWEAQGLVVSQNKVLTLKGQGDYAPELNGSIHIDSEHFPLLRTEAFLIDITPQLIITFKPNFLDLKGTVIIPTAQIKPQTFNKTVSLTDDAVFVGTKSSAPPNPFHINTDVRLKMGDQVVVNTKGLNGSLVGSIHLHQSSQEQLSASGELDIRDGKYRAYGQDLTVDQGQLLFTGGLFDNPGIRIRAVRHFNNTTTSFSGSNQLLDFNSANLQTLDFGNNTTVGIEVTGRLKSPKVQLFSVPSTFPKADILSLLLLGKPANQASQAGGQLLFSAIRSMNLDTGTGGIQLLDQLNKTFGVDLNIKSSTKINQETNQISESNAVVVGKALSKRLYVSYNFGLTQTDANVLTISYLLNKFFSIQVNASVAASGADLLYTHQQE